MFVKVSFSTDKEVTFDKPLFHIIGSVQDEQTILFKQNMIEFPEEK